MDFFDMLQQHSLYRHGRRIDETQRKVGNVRSKAEQLTSDFDRLQLAVQSMWELLRERTGLTDADLVAKIREVDLRDGSLDGKGCAAPRSCNACGRTNNARRAACVYCGVALDEPTAF